MNQIQGISQSPKQVHFLQPKDLSMMTVKKILEQPILPSCKDFPNFKRIVKDLKS